MVKTRIEMLRVVWWRKTCIQQESVSHGHEASKHSDKGHEY